MIQLGSLCFLMIKFIIIPTKPWDNIASNFDLYDLFNSFDSLLASCMITIHHAHISFYVAKKFMEYH